MATFAFLAWCVASVASQQLLPAGLGKRDNPALLILPRQLPAQPTDVETIITPSGANVTFKEPGTEGICETTEGVRSFTGFVNIAEDVHTFFWFFESRNDPANDPVTLWLGGGPGSDSTLGLFAELGPCNVTQDLETELNPFSWNEVSNLLFLSQPVGVGFSYGTKEAGDLVQGEFFPEGEAETVTGRYPVINASAVDTTELAAVAAWEVLQGFLSALPELSPEGAGNVTHRDFNLATQSYGGHWGPAFYRHFYEQNQQIENGSLSGVQLDMTSLTIVNGIIDFGIQANYYPIFAESNTYEAYPLNDTVLDFMRFSNEWPQGCQAQSAACAAVYKSDLSRTPGCSSAAAVCRTGVEYPWYFYSDLGTYDIRLSATQATNDPPLFFVEYLNLPEVQNSIGVDTNVSIGC
jgi:carboxypeptidase C (cathepsin A)